jgi:hypothetical protein
MVGMVGMVSMVSMVSMLRYEHNMLCIVHGLKSIRYAFRNDSASDYYSNDRVHSNQPQAP